MIFVSKIAKMREIRRRLWISWIRKGWRTREADWWVFRSFYVTNPLRREPTRRGRYQDRLLECQAGKSPYWIFPFSNSACAVPIRKKLMAAQPGEGDSGRNEMRTRRDGPPLAGFITTAFLG